ncbi:MAG: hypothetical protein QXE05_06120 [Nitrososphaeria archaeon]
MAEENEQRDNENIEEINYNNLTEEERLTKIKKLRELLFDEEKNRKYLSPLEKLYVMGNLCALNDTEACHLLAEATLELRRQAEEENNEISRDMLIELGLWTEKPKKKE